jgi:hypothetical protein
MACADGGDDSVSFELTTKINVVDPKIGYDLGQLLMKMSLERHVKLFQECTLDTA